MRYSTHTRHGIYRFANTYNNIFVYPQLLKPLGSAGVRCQLAYVHSWMHDSLYFYSVMVN